MGSLALRDGVMDSLLQRDTRFDERAYAFVLASLEYLQSRLPERRHVDGRELAHAVRELALDQFGVMSRLVLAHWGIQSTADLGEIVFALVDSGLLMSQPSDRRVDFVDVYDFDEAFEVGYPWSAGHLA